MAIDYETVMQAVSAYVHGVANTMPVFKAVLYGSYAKGTANEYSDVDICFFMESFGDQRRVDIVAKMLGLTQGYNTIYIEPRVFEASDIGSGNPFVNEVLATGKEIPIL